MISNNFKSFLKVVYTEENHYSGKEFEEWILSQLKIHELEYIHQPNGSQKPPDFKVKVNSTEFIYIECKSSQLKNRPMWNSSLPQQDVLYLFSSGLQKNITISLGQHHLNKKEIEELMHWKGNIKQYIHYANTQLTNKFIKFYPRIAYEQIKTYCKDRDYLYSNTLLTLEDTSNVV